MELELVNWIEQYLVDDPCVADRGRVLMGVGDDGAVLAPCDGRQVLVTDAIVQNVHFSLDERNLFGIGHKAIAINLSDIAAMGASAETALVTMVLPVELSIDDAKAVFTGIARTSKKHGVQIVGGDTVRHNGPLMVNVTVTGIISESLKSPNGWQMDGAQDGDVIVVSGPLGGSILGSHLSFEPRLELARSIQERVFVNAATDISDSLSLDLVHVLKKSGVGACLEPQKIPVSSDAKKLALSGGKTPLNHALSDGEDFELLLTLSPDSWKQLIEDDDFNFELYPIGTVTTDHVGQIVDANTGIQIEPSGYQH